MILTEDKKSPPNFSKKIIDSNAQYREKYKDVLHVMDSVVPIKKIYWNSVFVLVEQQGTAEEKKTRIIDVDVDFENHNIVCTTAVNGNKSFSFSEFRENACSIKELTGLSTSQIRTLIYRVNECHGRILFKELPHILICKLGVEELTENNDKEAGTNITLDLIDSNGDVVCRINPFRLLKDDFELLCVDHSL